MQGENAITVQWRNYRTVTQLPYSDDKQYPVLSLLYDSLLYHSGIAFLPYQ